MDDVGAVSNVRFDTLQSAVQDIANDLGETRKLGGEHSSMLEETRKRVEHSIGTGHEAIALLRLITKVSIIRIHFIFPVCQYFAFKQEQHYNFYTSTEFEMHRNTGSTYLNCMVCVREVLTLSMPLPAVRERV